MSGYTPAPHESRARFIAGSIDLIQRRDGCTVAEAEDTAIGEWERWMEWHNVRVRRGVVVEEPEWEYGIHLDAYPDADVVPVASEQRARGHATVGGVTAMQRTIRAGKWVPVKQEDETTNREIERQSNG